MGFEDEKNIFQPQAPKEETMAENTESPDHRDRAYDLTVVEKVKLNELKSNPEKYGTFKTKEFFPAYKKLLAELDDPKEIIEAYDQLAATYLGSTQVEDGGETKAVDRHELYYNDFHWNEANQHFTTGRLYQLLDENMAGAKEAILDIIKHRRLL